jgi:hypothetical protein
MDNSTENFPCQAGAILPDQPKKTLLENVKDWSPSQMGSHVNLKCSIESECCTEQMSDAEDLCTWHRARMAQHSFTECDCQTFIACVGDSTGRLMFRYYYDCNDIPVVDSAGFFYCCSKCANTDNYTHTCGYMKVCSKHLEFHVNAVELETETESENEI